MNNKLINKLSLLLASKEKISKLDNFLNYQNNSHISACDIANKLDISYTTSLELCEILEHNNILLRKWRVSDIEISEIGIHWTSSRYYNSKADIDEILYDENMDNYEIDIVYLVERRIKNEY